MVVYNYSGKEVNAKIVYYGPALSGKTTNLEWIYSKIPVEYSGKMVSLRTQADRTIFFDFLPLDLGMIDGFRTRFMLYTVPGQVHYNATRKMVLKGVDGVVFVADSEPGRMQDNIESLRNLRDNLTELGLDPDGLPLVLQWNKRDLPNSMALAELETELNPRALPSFEACALTGEGVYETLHKVCRLIYTRLTGLEGAEAERQAPLFGESIAQCLQDVDIPQPEPERVAVASGDFSGSRRPAKEALGAILGAAPDSAPEPASAPAAAAASASIAPIPTDVPPDEPSDKGPDTVDPFQGMNTPRPADDDSSVLGGLVDEVLDALDHVDVDDVPTVDRASSRPVLRADDVLAQRLGQEMVTKEPSHPIDESDPSTRDEAFSVEHDVSVFDHLEDVDKTRRSGVIPPVTERSAGTQAVADTDATVEFDLDAVLGEKSETDELDLITDPLRLPSESRPSSTTSQASGASRPFGGPPSNARVLEIPVSVDASELEEGRQIRIVLNLQIKP